MDEVVVTHGLYLYCRADSHHANGKKGRAGDVYLDHVSSPG